MKENQKNLKQDAVCPECESERRWADDYFQKSQNYQILGEEVIKVFALMRGLKIKIPDIVDDEITMLCGLITELQNEKGVVLSREKQELKEENKRCRIALKIIIDYGEFLLVHLSDKAKLAGVEEEFKEVVRMATLGITADEAN